MKYNKKIIFGIFVILLIVILISSYFIFRSPWKFREDRPIKIFWVDSYHEDFFWSIEQINGLKDSLNEFGIEYEIKDFHLNTFLDKNETNILNRAEEVKKLIDSWDPDLVYATDDNAQKYVSDDYIGTNLPWVFSGVNLEEKDYNFENSKNVVGIFERKPIFEALNMAHDLYPQANKLSVFWDNQITGLAIQKEALPIIENDNNFNIVNWQEGVFVFSTFKEKIIEVGNNSDLIFLLWAEFVDENNQKIPLENVTQWVIKNINIPVFSLWEDATKAGFLFSVEVSPYEHGYEAGKLIRQILIEGKQPRSIGSYVPKDVKKSINFATAKNLDLDIPSSILINSEVYQKFPWEEEK